MLKSYEQVSLPSDPVIGKKNGINLTTLQMNKAHFLKLARIISMTLRHFIPNSLDPQFQLLKHYFYAVEYPSKHKLNMHVKNLKQSVSL